MKALALLALLATPAWAANKAPQRLLSVLHPDAGTCVWSALPAPGVALERLSTVKSLCPGGSVVMAKGGTQAVLHFRARATESTFAGIGYPKAAFSANAGTNPTPGLWQVAVKEGKADELPPLPDGKVERVGYDDDGRVVALTLVDLPKDLKQIKDVGKDGDQIVHFKYKDRDYEAQVADGVIALAFAYRFTAKDGWTLFEDKPTTTDWDYALGVEALEAARLARARTDAREEDWESQEVTPKVQAALRNVLKLEVPTQGKDSNDGFIRLRSSAKSRGELLVWQVSGEFAFDTGLILFHAPGTKDFTPLAGLGYTAGDLVRLSFQGDFMLVTTSTLGAHPRLVDLKTGKIVYASDTDYGVTFWRQE